MTNNDSVTIRVPEEVKVALRKVAGSMNRKPADVARIALLEFLRSKGQDV